MISDMTNCSILKVNRIEQEKKIIKINYCLIQIRKTLKSLIRFGFN